MELYIIFPIRYVTSLLVMLVPGISKVLVRVSEVVPGLKSVGGGLEVLLTVRVSRNW